MKTFYNVGVVAILTLGMIGISKAQENAPEAQRRNQGQQGSTVHDRSTRNSIT
jgi:hypothetical protein